MTIQINGSTGITATTIQGVTDLTMTGNLSAVGATFTGNVTGPTANVGTNTTQIATTAFVLANGFPSGTKMPFYQASPPTGWTATAIQDDSMMRVVTAAGTGGTSGAGAGHSPILNSVVASHTHTFTGNALGTHTHTDSGHTHPEYIMAVSNYAGNGATALSSWTTANSATNSGYANLSSVSAGTPSGTNAANASAANWQPRYMDFCVGTKT
jgi:hypothetical protein